MAQEVETKVLNIDKTSLVDALTRLGATEVTEARLSVDWFRIRGIKEGEDPWFLRVRKRSDGPAEVTWKGKSDKLGASRQHKEINFEVMEPGKASLLFEALGLERYAHQDKDRTSWVYKDWRFDLDQYPGMPVYLEIEGRDEEHIQEAINLFDLSKYETSAEGERVLIQKKYGLNWYDMRFS
jgi:adenylate cyclase class 2